MVSRSSAASWCFHEDALVEEVVDVSVGSVLRAMIDIIPLGRGEFALKSVQQHVDDLALADVDWQGAVLVPKHPLGFYAFCLVE